ncbi:Yth domain-containing protein ect2 [Thalictrum thalictroides]|uniref:YTH domain-containing family protein n=1 Tax=Thalictrum thalictroides TaxID=46969 RepID=A0A7J6VT91_THATH|nr:Yth domain-containing protein ect2 [Thalictrum thalictroides]
MADEKKLEEFKQGLNIGLQSASLHNLTLKNKVSEKECSLSGADSSFSLLTKTTSHDRTNGFCQELLGEPGHNRIKSKLYDNGCFRARDESGTLYSGLHSNTDSLARLISGYKPSATRSMFSVEGKPIGPTASSNLRQSSSIRTIGDFDSKVSRVPLNSKSFPSTFSSNFSELSLHSLNFKSSNKVPQLGSNYRSAVPYKDSYSARNYSLPSDQMQRLHPDGPSSYTATGRSLGGYDGYNLGEKSSRSSEVLRDATRGPRSRRLHTLLNNFDEQEHLGPRVRRDRYNRSDLCTMYDNAKFFIIKSYSEDDVHRSIKYDVWSSTPHGNRKLNAAFHDAETRYSETGTRCPIFLFFSVNGSGQFLGFAEMIGPVDFEKDMDFWQQNKWNGFFPVTWHVIKDIPNNRLRHIILENNDNRPVTYTRDTQEVGLKQGLEMLLIFKNYSAMSSMLDDYKFYEDQEKSLQARKTSKGIFSGYEPYRTDSQERSFETGRTKAEQVSMRTSRVSDDIVSDSYTSLASLAKNLSLNHRRN